MAQFLHRYRWAITALLGLLALLAGWLLWKPAEPPPRPVRAVLVFTPTPLPTASPVPTATPMPLLVYVSGAVVRPGVYALSPGARVVDALEAAGGATAQADLVRINLARRVQDEEQIHIPRRGEQALPLPTPMGSTSAGSSPGGGAGGPVNINTAGLAELDALPGIGPGYAQRIIDYRQAHGPFVSIEDIQNVPGIGAATFARIRDLITVGD